MDDQEGLANCIAGLKKIAGYAEKKKITVCLEFLNSHDHQDYMADSTKWCVGLVHGVGSPRVKVLYDIYHAGMMKEDSSPTSKNITTAGATTTPAACPAAMRSTTRRRSTTTRFCRRSPTPVSKATWPRSSFPSGKKR